VTVAVSRLMLMSHLGYSLGQTRQTVGSMEKDERLTRVDDLETGLPCWFVASWPFLFTFLVDLGQVA
jgi:hypothetical protein